MVTDAGTARPARRPVPRPDARRDTGSHPRRYPPEPRRPETVLGAPIGRASRLWASLPRELARAFRPHADAMAGEILREVQLAVPEYARPLEGPFGKTIMQGIQQAVRHCLDNLGNPSAPQEGWMSVFRHLGKVEFSEGRSLNQLQTAYRVGGRVAWRYIAGVSQTLGLSTEFLCVGAEAIFSYVDEISALSLQGYAAAQARAAGTRVRQRRQLLELALADPPASPKAIAALAATTGWRIPDRIIAVALEPRDDQHQLEPPELDSEILMDLEGKQPCLLAEESLLPAGYLEAALRGWRAALGPSVPFTDAAVSLHWARRTMELASRSVIEAGPVVRATDHLTELWLLSDEFLIRELIRRCLAPLADRTEKQRERLGRTLLAWLQSSGTAPDMAERLGVHPQTVRYRMRQLEELFGDRLNDPESRSNLEIALRAQRLLTP
ncbi:helix-turn-helix domain-containing protein [Amycolatopsis cynarae]|uniref:Helix-turn-helix domain-containing protein n=1 Tax=Amycolatopsis cynarae TaxID=2995223 RepID=A0ABY7BFM9_9PSEU|nr:PucR family transcriptional regulator [Amycolatopsis sp. HUAS 11-8]WAL69428.1 helix-turn-helix domain-containing protein [Amycolatopsis sp. HUAS 11-8]